MYLYCLQRCILLVGWRNFHGSYCSGYHNIPCIGCADCNHIFREEDEIKVIDEGIIRILAFESETTIEASRVSGRRSTQE